MHMIYAIGLIALQGLGFFVGGIILGYLFFSLLMMVLRTLLFFGEELKNPESKQDYSGRRRIEITIVDSKNPKMCNAKDRKTLRFKDKRFRNSRLIKLIVRLLQRRTGSYFHTRFAAKPPRAK
jgi:hypothetical protein